MGVRRCDNDILSAMRHVFTLSGRWEGAPSAGRPVCPSCTAFRRKAVSTGGQAPLGLTGAHVLLIQWCSAIYRTNVYRSDSEVTQLAVLVAYTDDSQ